jgi:hypothetical protein
VARELGSGRLIRLWLGDGAPAEPPYDVGPDSLFIGYYVSAELSCHLALDWPMPARTLDLCVEFKWLTSGKEVPGGKRDLLHALQHFGLPALEAAEKQEMRDLAMRGGRYSAAERLALIDYCQTDVDALARLLPIMLPMLDLPRALLRGRYMAAAARMEWDGVPIDTDTLDLLRKYWARIKVRLIEEINRDYGVWVPSTSRPGELGFSEKRWAEYLRGKRIPWPLLESGRLAMDDDTFREMARAYPKEVGPVRELRHTLSQLRLNDLAVGPDGRNRCLLGAFGSCTGRNQPSNAKFIFGPSVWLRIALIRARPGRAIAYADWSGQEFGIAAALSGDKAMTEAYLSGDPYLWLAEKGGYVPDGATGEEIEGIRDRFKVMMLGMLYGLTAYGLANRLNRPLHYGRALMRLHRDTFRRFWEWSDARENRGILEGRLTSAFGWQVHRGPRVSLRTLRNFDMQANGGEMLRLACCLLTERGITVCAPVHDAVLVEAPVGEIDEVVARTQEAMREASELVLPGFPLRTKVKVWAYPDHYRDRRGARMWQIVSRLLADEVEAHRVRDKVEVQV